MAEFIIDHRLNWELKNILFSAIDIVVLVIHISLLLWYYGYQIIIFTNLREERARHPATRSQMPVPSYQRSYLTLKYKHHK